MLMLATLVSLARSAYLLMTTPRSPKWPAARHHHLIEEPECQWCGTKEDLEVHHEIPYHLDKSKELDDDNMITLCMKKGVKCHYKKGHKGVSWLVYEPNIRQMCNEHKRHRLEGND